MGLRITILCVLLASPVVGEGATARARDLGIPFDGVPGTHDAITDVSGVQVGFTTVIQGGPAGTEPIVRTGVTVILPRGKTSAEYRAAWFSLNGDGELTGIPYVEDYGRNWGPIGITNTNSVGLVRDAIGAWNLRRFGTGDWGDFSFGLPIVGETWDGALNDIQGLHVTAEHVWQALDGAAGGPVLEGNVGGGTGMMLYGFKGGSGTASRMVEIGDTVYTVGVLVQANFGGRSELTVAGVPVGREITDLRPEIHGSPRRDGSAIVVLVTDAPLLPYQLRLVAKRISHGLARTGTYSHHGSGEIFLAVSTADTGAGDGPVETWPALTKRNLDPIFKATVEATEEAIVNTLVAAETLEGRNGNVVYAIPHDRLRDILRRYGRLEEPEPAAVAAQ